MLGVLPLIRKGDIMYVDTMTIEQIKKEIESGMKYVCRKCADILGNKNYRRVCLKLGAEERHVFNVWIIPTTVSNTISFRL